MTTTTRKFLDPKRIHEAATAKINDRHADVVAEVEKAIEDHPVVVVGMAQNPHVRNVKNALKDAGIDFHYLEYGSYLSKWGTRLAIKIWSGWATFPQVFVRGVLIGGEDLTKAAIADGTLRTLASASASTKSTSTGETATA